MAQDEFLLWVKHDSPYKTAGDYLKAAASGNFKRGGAQSKDTDEVLTRMIEKVGHVKLTFIPFKSGAEAAVQLAGGHIDSHVNNPSESLGRWRGATQRPLCAFSPKRLPAGPKITATEGWSDVPTCVEQGLAIPQYKQAAHGMAAGQGHRGAGGLLCRPHEKGAVDAGMEGLYRGDFPGRYIPDWHRFRQLHQAGP